MAEAVLALVFDMDGTLIDSTVCVTSAYRNAVLAAGGGDCSAEQVIASFPLGPPRMILRHLLGREATLEDERAYLAALNDYAYSVVVYEGIQEALGNLSSRGVPLGVFTGASAAAARQLLEAAGLLELIAVVVGGDEIERPKPDPEGVIRACGLLGVLPSAAAYIGDSPLDLEAARRAGVVAIAAAWGHLFDPTAPSDLVVTNPRDLLHLVRTG